jgi:hypothetical protein
MCEISQEYSRTWMTLQIDFESSRVAAERPRQPQAGFAGARAKPQSVLSRRTSQAPGPACRPARPVGRNANKDEAHVFGLNGFIIVS